MADIVFKYVEMRKAADDIRTAATSYKNAASTFSTDFTTAIAGWEGTSKDKMSTFISGTVNTYISETIPDLLNALAELLDANADQMESADEQLAENIPS